MKMKHPGRLILLVVIFGLIVVAVNVVDLSVNDSVNQNANATANTNVEAANTNTAIEEAAKEVVASPQTITEEYGFYITALESPGNITITELDGTTVYEIDADNAISVMPAADRSIIVNSYGADLEEEVEVDGVPATRYTGTSAKDGSVVNYLLITVGEDLYFVRGTEAFLEQVEEELVFAKPE